MTAVYRIAAGLVLVGIGEMALSPFREIQVWWVNQQGRRAYRRGDYRSALEAFESAEKKSPGDPTIRFNEGSALFSIGKVADALKKWKQSADHFPADRRRERASVHYNIGNAFFEQKQWKEAEEAYKKALRLTPWDRDAKYNLELVLRQQRRQPPPQRQTRPPLPPPPPIERESQQRKLRRMLQSPWQGDRDW